MSSIYMMNMLGPQTDPCGTPHVIFLCDMLLLPRTGHAFIHFPQSKTIPLKTDPFFSSVCHDCAE